MRVSEPQPEAALGRALGDSIGRLTSILVKELLIMCLMIVRVKHIVLWYSKAKL